MKSFYPTLKSYPWDSVLEKIYSTSEVEVRQALVAKRPSLNDFAALLSPAAKPFLAAMVEKSKQITRRRFGNTMQMYVPMYVSNECQNICTYCGFSYHNKIQRLTLNEEQILSEARAIKELGFDHILIVSGEANKTVGTDYFERVIKLLRPLFSNISFEVQPLHENEYSRLIENGLYSVLVYQETYNESRYRIYHPKGKKSNFQYRLETADRLGALGLHKIGIGSLIGLEDWRTDSWFSALHLSYLRKNYWRTRYSISFPRLRPAEGYMTPNVVMSDEELVQLICAFRLFDENIELSLSTRESEHLRNYLATIGITAMSAGSKTEPGGYSLNNGALKQFNTSDERSPLEVVHALKNLGIEPVWKDWDRSFHESYDAA